MKKFTNVLLLCFLFGFTNINVSAQFIFPGNGSGTEDAPYEVSTITQLDYLRESGNKGLYFKQMDNINLSTVDNWDPIGDETVAFEGKFDGNGFKILNLKINRPDEDYVGLFGRTLGDPGATVFKKVIIENATIVGDSLVGGLVGRGNATIDSCRITNITLTGRAATGGITGELAANGVITASYAEGSVNGTKTIGGLIGQALFTTSTAKTISDCVSDVTVTGDSIVGGCIGYLSTGNTTSSSKYVLRFASLNTVTGRKDVGGIIGSLYIANNGNTYIRNNYVSGDIEGTTGSVAIGGIIGRFARSGSAHIGYVENNVSTADVTGTENVGGIMGWMYQTVRTRNNVLAASEVSGTITCQSKLVGYLSTANSTSYYCNNYVIDDLSWTAAGTAVDFVNKDGEMMTGAELQIQDFFTTAANWDVTSGTYDFTNYWRMNTGTGKDGFPILKIAYTDPGQGTNISNTATSTTSVYVSQNGNIVVNSNEGIYSVSIFSLNGSFISNETANGATEYVSSASNFAKGVYIVKVATAGKAESFKILY